MTVEQNMTDEQRAVIESLDPHLFVAAAAGSGKTFVLVERFLRFVRDGLSPDQILTITYTHKAAAEMKKRIVEKLVEMGRLDDAQIAETGPIQTIHGFCQRILRENAIAAGLDPGFEILGGREVSALQSRCISEALSMPFDDDSEDTLVAELIEALAGRRGAKRGDQESPHTVLIDSIDSLLGKLRGTDFSADDLDRMATSPEALLNAWHEQVLHKVPSEIQELMPPTGTLHQRLEQAYRNAKIAKPRWLKPGDDDGTVAARHSCALIRVAAAAWRRLEGEMQRRMSLDFVLLERLAVELVENSAAVQDRLARQYKAVFIDEAQDLNPMQYRLLASLKSERRMFVGDIQQSIYGFRLADVDLFRLHPEKHAISPAKLSKNHRSNEGILAFVDELFGTIWEGRYQKMATDPNVIFLETAPALPMSGVEIWPQEVEDKRATAKLIQDMVAETGSAKDICVLVRRAKTGIELLQRLSYLGVSARLVGGTDQYYTRMEVRDVANVLRAVTNPYDDYSLLATLRSPFAGISLDAFVLLAHRTEGSRSVFERLQTTSVPANDRLLIDHFLSWFDPLRTYADRLAAWEAIGELYAKSPYIENLGRRPNHARLIANARKLLSLAASSPETGPADFAEQVRETQRLGHREGEAPVEDEDVDAVTIMTIHKAKGLEFPVVIVPDTFSKTRKSPWGHVVVDPRLPMVATRFPGGNSLFSEFVTEAQTERDTEEEWRVLYVALTRAKSRLCVVLDPRARSDTFAGAMAKALRLKVEEPPEGIRVREAL